MAEEVQRGRELPIASQGSRQGEPLTGIILAGGHSRRMGQDKAFLELGGQCLIEIVIGRVRAACDEVLVVASDPAPYVDLGVPIVSDVFRDVGALGGLHAGLRSASNEVCVVVGCDMPFLIPDLLKAFAGWSVGADVAVLRQDDYTEPLHGAYRRSCIGPIEEMIRAGRRRIVSFYPKVRVRYVTAREVAPFDEALRFIRNVNTPEQWAEAQAEWMAAGRRHDR